MNIENLVEPQGVIPKLRASSKKQALQELAERAAEITGVESQHILNTLLARERLGTTGVGQGIAIPHGRISDLDRLHGVFARLDKPVDFDAVDERPVDLIFLLLAPESAGTDHLKALAKVSRLLRDGTMCEKLRGSDENDAIYALLTEPSSNGK